MAIDLVVYLVACRGEQSWDPRSSLRRRRAGDLERTGAALAPGRETLRLREVPRTVGRWAFGPGSVRGSMASSRSPGARCGRPRRVVQAGAMDTGLGSAVDSPDPALLERDVGLQARTLGRMMTRARGIVGCTRLGEGGRIGGESMSRA